MFQFIYNLFNFASTSDTTTTDNNNIETSPDTINLNINYENTDIWVAPSMPLGKLKELLIEKYNLNQTDGMYINIDGERRLTDLTKTVSDYNITSETNILLEVLF